MNIFEHIKSLTRFAKNKLQGDNTQWQIFYMGMITTLNTYYLIARPYMGGDMGTYRIFIMKDGNVNQMEEVDCTETSVHVSSKSIDIMTTYGTFSFNRERDKYSFSHSSGEVCELEELSLLNGYHKREHSVAGLSSDFFIGCFYALLH